MQLLFNPDCEPLCKRFKDDQYEIDLCTVISRRRPPMVFTQQNYNDIYGPVSVHSDVETTNPTVGQKLTWDGTNWVNQDCECITPAQAAAIVANTAKISADGPVSSHSDVETTNPTVGQKLTWDGTNWVNQDCECITPAQAAAIVANTAKISADGPVSSHSDVETANPSIGQVLFWNGTNWVNRTYPERLNFSGPGGWQVFIGNTVESPALPLYLGTTPLVTYLSLLYGFGYNGGWDFTTTRANQPMTFNLELSYGIRAFNGVTPVAFPDNGMFVLKLDDVEVGSGDRGNSQNPNANPGVCPVGTVNTLHQKTIKMKTTVATAGAHLLKLYIRNTAPAVFGQVIYQNNIYNGSPLEEGRPSCNSHADIVLY
jgi:hypothetical protein